MPKYKITAPDGQSYEVNAPDGASEAEVMAYAQRSFKMASTPTPEKPFGQRMNEGIEDIPRQLGLTARAGLRAFDGTANLIGAPIRAGLNAILPDSAEIGPVDTVGMAEKVGLPRPRPGAESWVNDAASMGFSAAAPMAAGSALARGTTGTAQRVGQMFAANPAQQIASAGAAGGAGGYVRETGGNDTSQLVASLAAGMATPFGVNGAMGAGRLAGKVGKRMMGGQAAPQVTVDVTINNALRDSGLTVADLPLDVARGIRADVQKAMSTSGTLSPDAIRRLADYRAVGATPTAAGLTLDPAIVTQQKNLAKLGINSKDPFAQQLGRTENANNVKLIENLNTLGAGTADDALAGGAKVMQALEGRNARAQGLINDRYKAARAADGRAAALDPHAFTQRANNLLDEALLGGKLPADVRNLLNKAAAGEMPLTVDVAEQFKTRIGELQRSTTDMAERKALGLVRGALDDAPLLPGQQIGQEALDAFGKARSLNRAWMGIVEKTPALQAVRDGIEPDKFVQQFIVGGGGKSNVMDVAMLKNSIKSSPEALDAVRGQIASHLKQRALNGAADEVGNFSQSGYNKALQAIGDRKLRLFFSPAEINQLKAVGRVASYEQVQVKGSAAGNSNTAAVAGAALLERVGGSSILSKIPFAGMVQEPMQNIAVGMQAQRALDPAQALIDRLRLPQAKDPALMLSPAVFMGEDDRYR